MRGKSKHPLSLFSLITVLVGINVGANFIAVLSLTFLSPLIRRPSDNSILIQEISGGIIGANPISFRVPTLIAILHLLPLIRVAGGGQYSQALLETAKKRLLDVPLVQASVSFIGWLIGTLEPFYRAYVRQVDLPISLSVSLVVTSIVFAILCFVIVYFSLEFSIRKLFIPSLFPDGRLSEYKSVINLSIRSRFFIFYFAVTVFPIFLLYSVLVAKIDQSELQRLFVPLTILAAVLLAVGALITYLVSGSYHTPLVTMKKSTERIRMGSYDVKTPVLSNDEVGNLAEGLNEMAEGLKEKEFVKDTFGKMVDPSVRDHLLSGNLKLGGEIREATVLFSDIRGFTTLSEKMRPDEVVHLLNRYFDRICRCIQEEGGASEQIHRGFRNGCIRGADPPRKPCCGSLGSGPQNEGCSRCSEPGTEKRGFARDSLWNRHPHGICASRKHRFGRSHGVHGHRRCCQSGLSDRGAL